MPHSPTLPATCALFDMDGLILDTEHSYTIAANRVLGEFGHAMDSALKAAIMGKPATESARHVVDTLNLPITPDEFLEQRSRILADLFPASRPLPGAVRLIEHLSSSDIPIAVATSSSRDLFKIKTQRHTALFNLFDLVVTGDDPEIVNGKPAPDIFVIAATRLGHDARSAVVFEDSPNGALAGLAAGSHVVAVPDSAIDRGLFANGSILIDSLQAFRPQDFGWPGFGPT